MKAKAGLQCEKLSMEGDGRGIQDPGCGSPAFPILPVAALGSWFAWQGKMLFTCLSGFTCCLHLLSLGLLYAAVASEQMKMYITGFNLCGVNFGKAPCIPKVLFFC